MMLFSIKPYQNKKPTHVGVDEASKSEIGAAIVFAIVGIMIGFAMWSSKWEEPMPETVR